MIREPNLRLLEQLIYERDKALAKNSDLQQWLEVAREMINDLAKRNGDLAKEVSVLKGAQQQ